MPHQLWKVSLVSKLIFDFFCASHKFKRKFHVRALNTIKEIKLNSGRGNFLRPLKIMRMTKLHVTQISKSKNITMQKIIRPFSSLVQVWMMETVSQSSIRLKHVLVFFLKEKQSTCKKKRRKEQ